MSNWIINGVMLLKGLPIDSPKVIETTANAFLDIIKLKPRKFSASEIITNDMTFGFIAGATLATTLNVISNIKKEKYLKIFILVMQRIFYGVEKTYEIEEMVKAKMFGFENISTLQFQRAFKIGEKLFSNFPHEQLDEIVEVYFLELLNGNMIPLFIEDFQIEH